MMPPSELEKKRLEALAKYQIMDTPAEAEYDDFTWLASSICQTPMSTITLVDATRQWFKSRIGVTSSETPREFSFCQHALHDESILEVPDAHKDSRFSDNPLVTSDPNIRFYAGVPLRTIEGLGMGTLCVMDRESRKLTDFQCECLSRLGRQLVCLMELRLSRLQMGLYGRQVQQAEARYRDVVENTTDLIFTASPTGQLEFINKSWQQSLGYSYQEVLGKPFLNFLAPEDRESVGEVIGHLLEGETVGSLAFSFVRKDGTVLHALGTASCRFSDKNEPVHLRGIFRDVTQERLEEQSRQELVGRLQKALSAVSLCLSEIKGGNHKTSRL